MKKKPGLREEVGELLEQATVAEVSEVIWKTFENAFGNLSVEDRWVLEQHFQGVSNDRICQVRNLSTNELDTWISQAKRNLLDQIRRNIQVKQ